MKLSPNFNIKLTHIKLSNSKNQKPRTLRKSPPILLSTTFTIKITNTYKNTRNPDTL